jgi:hypothetical protein
MGKVYIHAFWVNYDGLTTFIFILEVLTSFNKEYFKCQGFS